MSKKLLITMLVVSLASSSCFAGMFDWFWGKEKEVVKQEETIFDSIRQNITSMEKQFTEWKDNITEKLSQVFDTPKVTSDYDKAKKLYVIEVELPGYEENEIQIQGRIAEKQKYLLIKAVKTQTTKEKQEKEDHATYKTTAEAKSFQTTRTLPSEAIVEKASWTYKNGMLRIEIPYQEKQVDIIDIKKGN